MDAPTFIREVRKSTEFTKLPKSGDLEFWAVITVHGFRPIERLYFAQNVCDATCEAVADIALMAGPDFAGSISVRVSPVTKEAA